jgi:hypothetical protein
MESADTRVVRRQTVLNPGLIQSAGTALLVAGLAAYGLLVTVVAPISTRVFYDPAVQYMLASLAVFRGASYHYIDHPGTPVELLGTLGLALTYPFVSGAPEGFIAHHLAHPEQFMAMAQGFLAVTSIATCVFFIKSALVVRHWSQALAAVGLGGTFFGLHPDAFSTLAIWSHASFCFIGGTLLSSFVLLAVRQPHRTRWRAVLALGFACGVLTSIQLYFAAWVIGTAIALTLAARLSGLKTRYALRRGEATFAMAAFGFVVATLPIHDHYLEFASWIVSLSTHEGIYGDGPQGFSSPELLASNALDLVQQQPVLFAVTAAALALTLVRIVRPTTTGQAGITLRAVGAGLVIQTLVLIVLVAKHPGSKYLLPIAATLPVLLAVMLESTEPLAATSRRFAVAVGVVGLVFFGNGLRTAFDSHVDLANTLRRDDTSMEVWLDSMASKRGVNRDSLRILWTYGTTSQCYAIWYAEWSTDYLFQNDVARLCPRDGNLDIWQGSVSSSSGSVDVKNVSDWDVEVIPRNLLERYPRARLPGDVYETQLSSINTQQYGPLTLIGKQ